MTKLFIDSWYIRASNYIENEITDREYQLFSENKIRKIYSTLDHLLLDNLSHYSRIIRTIMYLYENLLVDDGIRIERIGKRQRYLKKLSPTTIYYSCMLNEGSSIDEILLAYPDLEGYTEFAKSFADLYPYLLLKDRFAFNTVYAGSKFKTNSYQKMFELDQTKPEYLQKILPYNGTLHVNQSSLNFELKDFRKNYDKFIEVLDQISKLSTSNLINSKSWTHLYSKKHSFYIRHQQRFEKIWIHGYDQIIDQQAFQFKELLNQIKYLLQNNMILLAKHIFLKNSRNFRALKYITDGYAIVKIIKRGKSFQILEEFYTNQDQFLYSSDHKSFKDLTEVCETLIGSLRYFVFDIDWTQIKNIDLTSSKEIVNHIILLVDRFGESIEGKLELLKIEQLQYLTKIKNNHE